LVIGKNGNSYKLISLPKAKRSKAKRSKAKRSKAKRSKAKLSE
jgi:hypothetical protein